MSTVGREASLSEADRAHQRRGFLNEAKSNNSLKSDTKSPVKTVGKYRHFAEELGATGVIFATSQPAWDEVSEKAITETFAKYPHLIMCNLTQPIC